MADHYLEAFGTTWRAIAGRLGSRQPGIVRLAFLVERAPPGGLGAGGRASAGGLPTRSARCLGPWPPYSFV